MKPVQFARFILIFLFFYSATLSAAVLDVQGGILKGAFSVNVNGNLYDVSFEEGSCIGLFSGCDDASDFFFPVPDTSVTTLNNSEANAASQALLDQVFVDSALEQFDSDASLSFGCDHVLCDVFTPVFVETGGTSITAIFARNYDDPSGAADTTGTVFGRPVSADTGPVPFAGADTSIFAVWSNSTVIPIPPTVWLFCSGFLGLAMVSRRH